MACGFAYGAGYTLTPAQPPAGYSYPPASPHRLPTTHQVPGSATSPRRDQRPHRLAQRGSAWALLRGYGNINPLSIDYACRPRLRSRLTLGGLAWPRNPWSSGGRVSHSAFATHACILTPTPSTTRSRGCFPGCRTLPYPSAPLHNTPKSEADVYVPMTQLRRYA